MGADSQVTQIWCISLCLSMFNGDMMVPNSEYDVWVLLITVGHNRT